MKKILLWLDEKSNSLQTLSAFIGIMTPIVSFVYNFKDIKDDSKKSIYALFIIYLVVIVIVFILPGKKKNNKPPIGFISQHPDIKKRKIFNSFQFRMTILACFLLVTIIIMYSILKIVKKDTTFHSENFCILIRESALLNSGSPKFSEDAEIYSAKILPPYAIKDSLILYTNASCFLSFTLQMPDSLETLKIDSILVEVTDYTQNTFNELPILDLKYSKKIYQPLFVTIGKPVKPENNRIFNVDQIKGGSLTKFNPVQLKKFTTDTLLLRINAENEGLYTFNIKLYTTSNTMTPCVAIIPSDYKFLFIK